MIGMRPFKFWVQSVLPLVYDDSLSYYELLCKVVNYINNLIENDKELVDGYEQLSKDFEQLQEYVDNYFDSTDFQQLVEDKLDEMVEDGTLEEIIERVTRPHIYWIDYESETPISTQLTNAKNSGYTAAEFVINKNAQPIIITESIVVPSGMTIYGNGAILYAHNRSDSRTNINPIFDLTDKNWVNIIGFRLGIDDIIFYPPSAVYDNPDPKPLIYLKNTNNVVFRDIVVEDYYTSIDLNAVSGYTYSRSELWSVLLATGCNNTTLENFNVNNYYDEGLTFVDCEFTKLMNCEVHGADLLIDTRSYTPLNLLNTNNSLVDGCHFEHYSQTSLINLFGSYNKFVNSTFIDHDGHETGIDVGDEVGLNVEKFIDISFVNCRIKSWFNAFHKNQEKENFVIDGCYIDATGMESYALVATAGSMRISNCLVKANTYVFNLRDGCAIESSGNKYYVAQGGSGVFRYYADIECDITSEDDYANTQLFLFSLNQHADLTKSGKLVVDNFHGRTPFSAANSADTIDAKLLKVIIKNCENLGSVSFFPELDIKYINNIFAADNNLCIGLYSPSNIVLINNIITTNSYLLYLFAAASGCTGYACNNRVVGENQGYIIGGLQAAGQNNGFVCFNNLPQKTIRVGNASYGTTDERPTTTFNGLIRFNTALGKFEKYDGGWTTL